MNLTDLKRKPVGELVDMARDMGLENLARSRRQEVIAAIVRKRAKDGEDIYGEGTLEILQDGFGFLRSPDSSYLAGPDDIYVSPSQIRRFNLRTGDSIAGKIRPPKDGERYFALLKSDQLQRAEHQKTQNPVRESYAAVSQCAHAARTRQRQHRRSLCAHRRPDRPHRQRPAGSDRVTAEGR